MDEVRFYIEFIDVVLLENVNNFWLSKGEKLLNFVV